ncbi:50S ribosomal protein L25/general stress protein Ctc [Aquella oligotrophica]|uniref:Large ribosomal subunit protein bL25 n=1 Tax=Aquella oligotrophica TaxID=2067065 RepID=A0A2I7N4Q0_9NEIS|nr:50S ribosomal protein L25/general stress protein Ctc [Aquella oligotrophica]AUR51439.1 50S ribosomal protein L25 [Aquella oligotrophica]
MSNLKLVAEARAEQGRGASRRLRHAGKVPAIVYGGSADPVAVTLDHNTVFHALKKEAFHTSILDLELAGKSEKVVLRDFHMHSFRPEVLHLDLQRVSETEEIHMKLPLHFLNEEISQAVKVQGAHVTHVATEVEVRALAKDLPHFIEVDLANLKAGQTIHLSDLVLPAGVKAEKLLRGDDAALVIAGGIAEVADAEIVSPSDVPSAKGATE